jgi:RES domain-containing protein
LPRSVRSKRFGKIKPSKFQKRVCRIIARHYGQVPLSLEGSLIYGGRYNIPYQFGALYCGITEDVCWAEIEKRMEGTVKRSRFRVYQLRIYLQKVLDLTDPQVCTELKIDPEFLIHQNQYVLTRQIAKEARDAGFEAIIAPSATGTGVILAIFSDRLDPRSRVEIVKP